MTCTELIKHLEEIVKTEGDLPITRCNQPVMEEIVPAPRVVEAVQIKSTHYDAQDGFGKEEEMTWDIPRRVLI